MIEEITSYQYTYSQLYLDTQNKLAKRICVSLDRDYISSDYTLQQFIQQCMKIAKKSKKA